METNVQPVKKPRLEWLDAMRGFTMILVVANHVAQIGFLQSAKVSSSLPFLMLFRMPLFFFISGFLAYKASLHWDLPTLCRMTGKKLRIQIIPTVVFFFFFAAVVKPDFATGVVEMFHSSTKGGYWFTLALLYMFLIYYAFAYLESKVKWQSCIPILLFFVVSLLVYESCYLPKYFWWANGYRGTLPTTFLNDSSLIQVMQYMPFFLFGNIVHRYWHQAQQVMDSKWFYPVIVVLVVFCTLDVLKWHTLRMAWTNLPQTLAKFILLTIVFMYFRHYDKYFTRMTVIGNSLQYIGRRTLDIYLIHFLFMPNLPGVGSFFQTYRHNFIIDTTLSVFIALLVIVFCIISSNILRVSPFFKKYLFGR
ncbi:MAG: acyltransferase [Prevotella sp.]|nr:acyltransferase [Prevotella sp.]